MHACMQVQEVDGRSAAGEALPSPLAGDLDKVDLSREGAYETNKTMQARWVGRVTCAPRAVHKS